MTTGLSSSALLSEHPQSNGWQAALDLRLEKINGRTCLLPQQRLGPLTVQRAFYPEGDVCHVYVLHPPGGVVGGDKLKLEVEVKTGARALITTPGASKYYRSAGKTANLKQIINVNGDASLEFFPLESIYFPATELKSKIIINLDKDAQFAGWEIHCFGLPANKETFNSGHVLLNTELRVDGKVLLHDRLKVDHLEQDRTSGLRGNPVYGSLVVYSKSINKGLLDSIQSVQTGSGLAGISLVAPDMLVARYLGDSSEAAQAYFRQLWRSIRPVAMGLGICEPRIWNT